MTIFAINIWGKCSIIPTLRIFRAAKRSDDVSLAFSLKLKHFDIKYSRYNKIRMHLNRTRTARFISHMCVRGGGRLRWGGWSGVHQKVITEGYSQREGYMRRPHQKAITEVHNQQLTPEAHCRISPSHLPFTPPPNCMLGYTHSCPIACWDTHTPAQLHAEIHPPAQFHAGIQPPPVNRMTDIHV